MKGLRQALHDLYNYWFGYGSPTPLGLMRILIGLVALLSLLITVGQFTDWYTEAGFVPAELGRSYLPAVDRSFKIGSQELVLPFDVPRVSLLGNVTDSRVTAAFCGVTMLAAVLTTLGLWTRASSIALAIGVVSLHHRNGWILHGGDTLIRIAVLYLAISPCGRACSLDRLLALWKGKAPPGPDKVSVWPIRLVQYNLALIYFTTVWHKWGGEMWRNGTATWYPARLNEFKRFPVPPFMNEMPFVRFTTYGTLLTELAMATLVFYRPLRKWVLMAGLLMHGFIEYSMNIPLFSFAICSLYVAHFEGEEIAAWARRMGDRLRKFRIRILYPVGTVPEPGPAAMLEAVDPLGLVEYEPGVNAVVTAVDQQGRSRKPFSASLKRSVGAWVIAPVPGLWKRLLRSSFKPVPQPEVSPAAEAVSP